MIEKIIFLFLLPFVAGALIHRLIGRSYANWSAGWLFTIVLRLVLPIVVVLVMLPMQLSLQLVYLPITAAAIMLTLSLVAWQIGIRLGFGPGKLGVFRLAAMNVNTGIAHSLLAIVSIESLGLLLLFDLGHALLLYTYGYFLAQHYGEVGKSPGAKFMELVTFPPMLALVGSIVVNIWLSSGSGLVLPETTTLAVPMMGELVVSLALIQEWALILLPSMVLLALGLKFSPQVGDLGLTTGTIALRIGGGCGLALLAIWLLGLTGGEAFVVLVAASLPVGFNTAIYASETSLDQHFATNVVSYSTAVGLVVLVAIGWLVGVY